MERALPARISGTAPSAIRRRRITAVLPPLSALSVISDHSAGISRGELARSTGGGDG